MTDERILQVNHLSKSFCSLSELRNIRVFSGYAEIRSFCRIDLVILILLA